MADKLTKKEINDTVMQSTAKAIQKRDAKQRKKNNLTLKQKCDMVELV